MQKNQKTALAKAAKIKLMIFDVDGVMTDGRLYYGSNGEEIKVFNAQDGFGINMLKKNGIKVAIISGRNSSALDCRINDLKFDYAWTGVGENKEIAFAKLLKKSNLTANECGIIGDDIPDMAMINVCGFSAAPANAVAKVIATVDWQTNLSGGMGAVREICEFVISAQSN